VREQIARLGLSQRQLAREIGLPAQVLTRWLHDEPRPNEEERVTTKLTAWVDAAAESPTISSDFVATPTAKKILGCLAFCRRTADMACVYGGPGVGKTRAIQAFQLKYSSTTWVATMTPASSGLVSALEVVAEAVKVADTSGGARRISKAIRAQVEGRGGIIIIDESQHLSMAAIEELRSIHDSSGVGLALVGNENSYARLTGGSRSASYAQIFSRIGMKLFVHRPDAEDVAELARHLGVRDKDAIALLQKLGARPGALRGAVKAIHLAVEYGTTKAGARDVAKAVTVATLRDAVRTLGAEV